MEQTLTLSERLYRQLESTAHNGGFDSIDEFIQKLIEVWQAHTQELYQRQETVGHIDTLRERLFATYGEMKDSVELVRSDRER